MSESITKYHVFTDHRDGWYGSDQFDEAKAQYLEWGDEFGCARLYIEVEDENGDTVREDCLESTGDYPA